MVYVTDINEDELDLVVFQIKDYDNRSKVMETILINRIDAEEVSDIIGNCDSLGESNNKFYDYVYHGFFEYLKERKIWFKKVDMTSYYW